jgi:Metallo-peptidase family M12/FG-GAP-like repeat/Calx-beta domain
LACIVKIKPVKFGRASVNWNLCKFGSKTKLTVSYVKALAFSVAIGFIPTLSAHAATPVPMLTPVSVESIVARGQAPKSAMSARAKGVKTDSMAIGFNAAALHGLPQGGESLLTLPNGKQHVVVKQSQTNHADGSISWVGALRDVGGIYKVIATTGPGGTFASIQTPDGEWAIAPGVGAGFDFLVNATQEAQKNPTPGDANDFRFSHNSAGEGIDPTILASTYAQNTRLKNEIAERTRFSPPSSSFSKSTPTPQATIDVLVVVTKGFADFHGVNMEARINQLFATTNAAYVTSESAITIRRAGAALIKDYSDTAVTKDVALTQINNNTGIFADLEDVRASVGADLVALLRNVNDGGIGYVGQVNNVGTGPESWNNPRSMYSVTGVCNFSGTGCDSVFAHELGHNMGLQHDRANAGTNSFGTRPYSFGWKINSGDVARDFRTIMSYAPPNGRVMAFSNPNLFICNPAGWTPADACGNANSEDNARVLNENRLMLAAIKTVTGASVPTKLVLTADRTRYPSLAGTASVKVARLGDPAAAVSVNYATVNGTAIAGTDFNNASGTLTWAANDTAAKTINITTLTTSSSTDRSFSVALSNAVGPAGTAIAQPSSLTLTLAPVGIWPPGNVLPTGWVQSVGAGAGWSVVNTEASEGSYSLKSGVIADNQNASIEFTATTFSGIMSFYRKVSSEASFDYFRFFVDGVEIATAAQSGESDWALVNATIAAGSHTFKFSYVKDNGVASGQDAAWIDNLLLPKADSVKPNDFDGDGKSDLLIQTNTGTTYAWLMNGTTISRIAPLLANDPGWVVSHTADFNNDGKVDLLWRNTNGSVIVWLMDGSTVLSSVFLLGADPGWRVSHVADFNGDGKADILWRNTNGAVALWLMNGSTVLSSSLLLGPNPDWSVSHVADFNGDGKADILWRNTNGAVNMWLMNGTAVASAAAILGPTPDWSVSHVADFNGDGKVDILWRNINGAVNMWLMNGVTPNSLAAVLGPTPDWSVSHVADFNGDGKADILWRNTNGAVSMWLMNGTAPSSFAVIIDADPNWRVSHIVDLNGDGKADLIWRNLDGSINAWTMNGTVPITLAGLIGAGAWKVVP